MLGRHGTSPRKDHCKFSKYLHTRDGPLKYTQRDDANSTLFLENVLDMAETLSKVMNICGIDDSKANNAVETIANAFLHYEQIRNNFAPVVKNSIRKEELYHDLIKKCLMTRVEARLAHMIIKKGFKAFYYIAGPDAKPSFPDECVYVHAAKKTAQQFSHFKGLNCAEQFRVESKIKTAYEKYYNHMQERMIMAAEKYRCRGCSCGEGMELVGKSAPETYNKSRKPAVPSKCKCKKCVRPKKKKPKVQPKCLDLQNPCTCGRPPFKLPWIKSIWERRDMKLYYKETIGEEPEPIVYLDPCEDWRDPSWLKQMAGYSPPAEAACTDWFDPAYSQLSKDPEKNTHSQDEHSAADSKPISNAKFCKEWADPSWMKHMVRHSSPTEAACTDWFDPAYSKFSKVSGKNTHFKDEHSADDSKPLDDVKLCKEWADLNWFTPKAEIISPSQSACADWPDPSYLTNLPEKK